MSWTGFKKDPRARAFCQSSQGPPANPPQAPVVPNQATPAPQAPVVPNQATSSPPHAAVVPNQPTLSPPNALVPTAPAFVPTAPAFVPTAPAFVPTAPAFVPTQPSAPNLNQGINLTPIQQRYFEEWKEQQKAMGLCYSVATFLRTHPWLSYRYPATSHASGSGLSRHAARTSRNWRAGAPGPSNWRVGAPGPSNTNVPAPSGTSPNTSRPRQPVAPVATNVAAGPSRPLSRHDSVIAGPSNANAPAFVGPAPNTSRVQQTVAPVATNVAASPSRPLSRHDSVITCSSSSSPPTLSRGSNSSNSVTASISTPTSSPPRDPRVIARPETQDVLHYTTDASGFPMLLRVALRPAADTHTQPETLAGLVGDSVPLDLSGNPIPTHAPRRFSYATIRGLWGPAPAPRNPWLTPWPQMPLAPPSGNGDENGDIRIGMASRDSNAAFLREVLLPRFVRR
jgi:hypothetical protein